ncbi:MAG: PAS domain S-box protein [Trueperaceae bacterium]|nr:PAS domain S-box protein [Trueperaceae bacterium]
MFSELEGQFERLLEAAPDAMVIVDASGMIIQVNAQTEKVFGYKRQELLGKSVELLIPQRYQEDHLQHRSEYLKSPRAQLMAEGRELYGRHRNGHEFCVEISLSPLETKQGTLVLSAIRDISERKKAEQQLRESQQLVQSAFHHAPIGKALIGRDGGWLEVNEAICKIVGYSKEELLNLTFQDITHPDDLDSDLSYVQELLERKRDSYRMEKRYFRKDGEIVWVQLSVAVVLGENGQVDYFISQIQDITEQKRAQLQLHESEARFRSAFDNAGAGMALVGLEGHYLEVNEALCKMLGYSEEELLAKRFQDITPESDRLAEEPHLSSMATNTMQTFQREKQFIRKDGKRIWVLLSVSNVYDISGKVAYFVNQIQDISTLKRTTQDLQAHTKKLERSNRDLQDFAYVASHDLQEPLRMVSSYVQLLERRYSNKLDQDAKDFIAFAVDGAQRMQRLINDLLAFSRVGTHGKAFELVSLEACLEDAKKNLRLLIGETACQINSETLPELWLDYSQMVLLFQNLIANAIKFRSDASPIIDISQKDLQTDWLISIRDNGIGIEAKYLEDIFTLFRRLHTRDVYEGTGIGLAVCRRIVERHGGKLWAESEPGKGSSFHISLPKHAPIQD